MENINGAFRKKKVYFSQVSNEALRDNNLSLKAKGLYALIQSYVTIENFTLYKSTLKKACIEGEKAFESTWKELKEKGYLVQYRLRGDKGCYYYEYELLDQCDVELANKIHGEQNRKTNAEKIHNPKKGGMDKNEDNHNPKKDGMDNGHGGKGYAYNNTDSNNTDLNNTKSISNSSKKIIDSFKNNICELKKTTFSKLIELIKNNNSDMILSVIEECATTNVNSYKGFETAFNSYIERGCKTKEDVINSASEYRSNHKKKSKKEYSSNPNKSKGIPFVDNCEAREEYSDPNYLKKIENKLLGWG